MLSVLSYQSDKRESIETVSDPWDCLSEQIITVSGAGAERSPEGTSPVFYPHAGPRHSPSQPSLCSNFWDYDFTRTMLTRHNYIFRPV